MWVDGLAGGMGSVAEGQRGGVAEGWRGGVRRMGGGEGFGFYARVRLT